MPAVHALGYSCPAFLMITRLLLSAHASGYQVCCMGAAGQRCPKQARTSGGLWGYRTGKYPRDHADRQVHARGGHCWDDPSNHVKRMVQAGSGTRKRLPVGAIVGIAVGLVGGALVSAACVAGGFLFLRWVSSQVLKFIL